MGGLLMLYENELTDSVVQAPIKIFLHAHIYLLSSLMTLFICYFKASTACLSLIKGYGIL